MNPFLSASQKHADFPKTSSFLHSYFGLLKIIFSAKLSVKKEKRRESWIKLWRKTTSCNKKIEVIWPSTNSVSFKILPNNCDCVTWFRRVFLPTCGIEICTTILMTLYTFHELEQNRFFHWKEKLASCFDVSYCMSIQRSIFFTLQSWEPSKKGSDIVSYLKKCITRLLITMLVNVLFTCAAAAIVLLHQPAEMTETSSHRFIVVSAFTQRSSLKCLRLWL